MMSEAAIAILCSGQGTQHREMFSLSAQASEAQPVFALAARYFEGVDPRIFVRDATEDVLFSNHAGQLLCCTQALAAWAALGAMRPKRAIIVGYSIGELAAWGCAGSLSSQAVLELADQRARLMDEASPPHAGLLSVTGLDEARLAPLLAQHHLSIAIVNDTDRFVLGGLTSELDAFAQHAQQAGAQHLKRIRVSVPSHTPYLKPASLNFLGVLNKTSLHRPAMGLRVLSGIDAQRVMDLNEGANKLAAQISQTLQWSACLQACIEYGAVAALELGPGDALSRMLESRNAPLAARAFDQFRQLEGVQAWLASFQ